MGTWLKIAVTCGVFLCCLCFSRPSEAQGTAVPKIVPPAPVSPQPRARPSAPTAVPKIVPPAPVRPEPRARPSAPVEAPVGAPVIADVVIEGTQRIDPDTVRTYLALKKGDAFDDAKVNESLKLLYGTGLFADVAISRNGGALVVKVVENPIINRIAFEGNGELDEESLSAEVQLRPRIVFTRTKVQKDVKRILDLYRRNGLFAAVVEPKIIRLPQNRVDLVFEIQEGPESGIRRISFVGNRVFSDSDLRGIVLTRESKWWRFLSSVDKYDPDRLTFDRELLRRHYLENGYADFRVASAVAELAPDHKDFFVTFTIEEGNRYKFGELDVLSRIKDVDPAKLKHLVTFKTGDWYSSIKIEETIRKLTEAAGVFGYAFVEVRPQVRRNRDINTIDIAFEIQEGPRVFVERIDIRGNTRTLDDVIRREFRLVEGDAFNSAKLRRSQQRIRNLGYFSKVDVNKVRGSSPDRAVVEVDVKEQPTGELTLGAGFSTRDGVVGEVGIRERNLLGRGQDLKFSVRLSQRTQQVDVGFTEPYFLNRNLSAGIDLFNVRSSRESESSFNEDTTGGRLRLGYEINERWSQSLRYGVEYANILNIQDDASQIIRDQKGAKLASIAGQTLVYDTRNSKIAPTEGYVIRLATDAAGLGGDVRYAQATIKSRYYYPFSKKWLGIVGANAGHIRGLGQDVRIIDRFFLGNDQMRGFEVGGIGARDNLTNDALGADTYAFGTLELNFPLGLPEELGFTGAAFVDFGTAFGADGPSSIIDDSKNLRLSAGVGIAWRSPLGPVRFDLAFPVLKEDFDKDQLINFSFGTRF